MFNFNSTTATASSLNAHNLSEIEFKILSRLMNGDTAENAKGDMYACLQGGEIADTKKEMASILYNMIKKDLVDYDIVNEGDSWKNCGIIPTEEGCDYLFIFVDEQAKSKAPESDLLSSHEAFLDEAKSKLNGCKECMETMLKEGQEVIPSVVEIYNKSLKAIAYHTQAIASLKEFLANN